MSAEQSECRDNESANRDNAPCEIGAERSDFGTEHVRRDMFEVLGGLPNCIRDGVGLFGRELGGGQCASDGVGVEHRAMVPRASRGRTAGPCDSSSVRGSAVKPRFPTRPRPVSAVRWNPMENDGRNLVVRGLAPAVVTVSRHVVSMRSGVCGTRASK